MFELAETHECMMDAKLEGGEGKGAVSYAKVNAVVDRAVHYFEEYLSTLGEGNSLPSRLPADSVRPALSAHFHLARLRDKYLISGEDAEVARRRLENKVCGLRHFRQIVDYCDRNPEAEGAVAAELPLCREMARLLPIKIEKMRLELATLKAAGGNKLAFGAAKP